MLDCPAAIYTSPISTFSYFFVTPLNSVLNVTGVADGEDHMWNRVFVHGEWYNLDVTWDDIGEEISHEYFNLSDEAVSADHLFHPVAADILPEILATGL